MDRSGGRGARRARELAEFASLAAQVKALDPEAFAVAAWRVRVLLYRRSRVKLKRM